MSKTTTRTGKKPRSKETKILLKKENASLQKRVARWEAIGAIASRLDYCQPLNVILNEAARECAQALDVDIFCVMFLNEEQGSLDIEASVGLDTSMLRPIKVSEGQSLTDAARSGLPAWAQTQSGGDDSEPNDFKHAIFHTLAFQNIPLGVLCVSREAKDGRFNRDEMNVIFSLANQISIAAFVEGPAREMLIRERAEREIQFAHALAREISPETLPSIPGYQIGIQTLHCLGTGGDFHDFICLPNDEYAILIGETAGRGTKAALDMANLLVCVRGGLAQGKTISEVVQQLNRHLVARHGRGQLVSLALIKFSPKSGALGIVRVGSTGAYIHEADGAVTNLTAGNGTPLGILVEANATLTATTLPPGAALFLTTDGINKCEDAEGVCYTTTDIKDLVRNCAEMCGRTTTLAGCVAERVSGHLHGHVPEDDITLYSLEREGHSSR